MNRVCVDDSGFTEENFMMQKLTKQKHIFAPLMHAISLFCMQSQASVKGNQLVLS